jgi:hypothetical protein
VFFKEKVKRKEEKRELNFENNSIGDGKLYGYKYLDRMTRKV